MQFLGFLFFVVIACGIFFTLLFLSTFLPFWSVLPLIDKISPKTIDALIEEEKDYEERQLK
ncbi:MAG: hypothetical protein ACK4ON_00915 [Bacteroidia bacterium]